MVLDIRAISDSIMLLPQRASTNTGRLVFRRLYVCPAHKRYFFSVRFFFFPSKSSAALRPDQGAQVSSAGLSVPGHSLEQIVNRAQSIAQPTTKNFQSLSLEGTWNFESVKDWEKSQKKNKK